MNNTFQPYTSKNLLVLNGIMNSKAAHPVDAHSMIVMTTNSNNRSLHGRVLLHFRKEHVYFYPSLP